MATTTNSSKLLLEGAAIVVSILLAFALQAWWDERSEEEEIDRLLTSILIEHSVNVEAVHAANKHRVAVQESIMELFSLAASQEPVEHSQLEELLGALTWMDIPETKWGSLNSLIEGGQLSSVDNVELRTNLVELHSFQRRWREGILVDDRMIFDTVLAPYLRKNASLPQIAMASSAITKPGEDIPTYDYDIPLAQTKDHSDLLSDLEFLGLLMQKLWTQVDSS